MSAPAVERRGPTVGRRPSPTGTWWERAVAMGLLWIIPVIAFVIVMFQGGAPGS